MKTLCTFCFRQLKMLLFDSIWQFFTCFCFLVLMKYILTIKQCEHEPSFTGKAVPSATSFKCLYSGAIFESPSTEQNSWLYINRIISIKWSNTFFIPAGLPSSCTFLHQVVYSWSRLVSYDDVFISDMQLSWQYVLVLHHSIHGIHDINHLSSSFLLWDPVLYVD